MLTTAPCNTVSPQLQQLLSLQEHSLALLKNWPVKRIGSKTQENFLKKYHTNKIVHGGSQTSKDSLWVLITTKLYTHVNIYYLQITRLSTHRYLKYSTLNWGSKIVNTSFAKVSIHTILIIAVSNCANSTLYCNQ